VLSRATKNKRPAQEDVPGASLCGTGMTRESSDRSRYIRRQLHFHQLQITVFVAVEGPGCVVRVTV